MNEPICAVCGETELSKLHGFNYGVCLCDRCVEIAAHSFIHDNAERKLKETEKKKESVDVEGMSKKEYESMRELKDKMRKDAKKMAECFEEIGKAIFVERDDQPESINDLKKALDKVKADLRTYKAMYRNRLEKFTNLMNDHKKLKEDYNKVIKGQDSWSLKFVEVHLEANRYRKRCGELQEHLSECAKRANRGILAASATGLIVGLILGYFAR
jgi:chromosome segregation ATPase